MPSIDEQIIKYMNDNKLSFFDAVWKEFQKMDAVDKLKDMYISQLEYLDIDEELSELKLTLNDEQKQKVVTQINEKIEKIKNGFYDKIFSTAFEEVVKADKNDKNKTLGGMSPSEYLDLILSADSGAIFFLDLSININNDTPIVKLDIDNNELDWQAFD